MKIHDIISEDVAGIYLGGKAITAVIGAVGKRALNMGPLQGVVKSKLARIPVAVAWIFKWTEIFGLVSQWVTKSVVLDDMLKKKEITDEQHSQASRLIAEEAVVSILATAAFLKVLNYIVKIVAAGRIASLASILTGPGAVLTMTLTTAAAGFVAKWLQTEEGRKAIAYLILHVVDPSVTWLWNESGGKIWGTINQASPEAAAAAAAANNKLTATQSGSPIDSTSQPANSNGKKGGDYNPQRAFWTPEKSSAEELQKTYGTAWKAFASPEVANAPSK